MGKTIPNYLQGAYKKGKFKKK